MFIQDRTTLLPTLTNLPPTYDEICLQVLDQMMAKRHFLFSTDSYHPQSIKTRERLRSGIQRRLFWLDQRQGNHSNLRCCVKNDDNKKQLCHYAASMEYSTGSFKAGENRNGCTDRRRESSSTHLIDRRIILIDQIDFTLYIITSAYKHQWPFVFQVEVRELPSIYSNQDT